MKFCYQVATPDVAIAPSVTSYQGALEKSFQDIAALGYDQAELMTVDPDKLDWTDVKKLAEKYNLTIPLICTGEVYGQLGISFVDPDPAENSFRPDAPDHRFCLLSGAQMSTWAASAASTPPASPGRPPTLRPWLLSVRSTLTQPKKM